MEFVTESMPEMPLDTLSSKSSIERSIVSPEAIPEQRYVGPHKPQEKHFDQLVNEPASHGDIVTAKPHGGLWTAPPTNDDSDVGNTYTNLFTAAVEDGSGVWKINFKPDTRVLLVDSAAVIESLPTYSNPGQIMTAIDFEQIFESYSVSGVYVTREVVAQYDGFNATPSLYYWDVESCILNTFDCIDSVDHITYY